MNQETYGFILLKKGSGLSSHAEISPLKKLFSEKVGHTGTLDPMATGMLVCAIGQATKFIQFTASDANKYYDAIVQLGFSTNTSDITGEKCLSKPVPDLTTAMVEEIIKENFLGKITQTPPIYSALKYKGKPYYYYARKNESIPIKSRPAEIFKIDNIQYNKETKRIHFQALVSSGTYIRTLAVDIAKKLNTVGCLAELDRVYIEPWQERTAHSIESIKSANKPAEFLLPIESALPHMQKITLACPEIQKLRHGTFVSQSRSMLPAEKRQAYDINGNFIGIVQLEAKLIKPIKLIQVEKK